jgi:hypothetical protein
MYFFVTIYLTFLLIFMCLFMRQLDEMTRMSQNIGAQLAAYSL